MHGPAPLQATISAQPEALTWVYAPVMSDGQLRYALAAGVSPQVFQELLLAVAQPGSTAALVDRNGSFVARTLHFQNASGHARDRLRAQRHSRQRSRVLSRHDL